MPSFYAPLPDVPPEDAMNAYIAFLAERNGTVDPPYVYPTRESWLNEANASQVRYAGTIDVTVYERAWSQFDARNASNTALMMLIALLKLNGVEAYAVTLLTPMLWTRPADGTLTDAIERLVTHEENYHTRILGGAAHHFGVPEPTSAYRPNVAVRVLIGSMLHAPKPALYPIVLSTEICGLFLFCWMLKRVSEVFAGQPLLSEVLEQRLIEIITDEIGHVAYNRLLVGDAAKWGAKRLAPVAVAGIAGLTPEFAALGWGRHVLADFDSFDFASLPAAARARGFFV